MSTTWFITGASRGMGRELTEQALARGDRVAATLRTPSQLDDLVAVHGHRLWVRQLDVTDTMQMGRVVEEAFTDHERIDVVVSNAGFGVFGVGHNHPVVRKALHDMLAKTAVYPKTALQAQPAAAAA